MPSIFTDVTANDYDLTIPTAADWTISTGGMPNSDNYLTGDGSISPVYNFNGDDFNIVDGTAWTVEWWFYYTAANPGASQYQNLICNGLPGTAQVQWVAQWGHDEVMYFNIMSTNDVDAYLAVNIGSVSTSTWYHFVVIKQTGNVLKMYKNNALVATDNTTNGTARTPTSSYRLFLGSYPNGTHPMETASYGGRLGKLAIYNAELSEARINAHYLSMTAT